MRITRTVAATIVVAALLGSAASCSSGGSDASESSTTVAQVEGADSSAPGDSGGSSTAPDLPADWPEELAIPDGVTVTDVATSGDTQVTVLGTVEGEAEGVVDTFTSQLRNAGWEIATSDFTASEQGGYGGVSGRSEGHTVAVNVGPDPTSSFTTITILLADA